MTWIRKRVWQMGIGTLLVLAGVVLAYTAGVDDTNTTLLWAGLILAWVGLAIPLASMLFGEEEEEEAEEEEKDSAEDNA